MGQDYAGHSAAATQIEGPGDLAYRGVMPKALGQALCGTSIRSSASDSSDHEEFATSREAVAARLEMSRRHANRHTASPATMVTTALVLGLRKVRAEYASLVQTWRELRLLDLLPLTPPASRPWKDG